MDNLFIDIIEENKDDIPILLIDKSESTKAKMESNLTILQTFGNIIENIFLKKNIQECYMLFWCDNVHIADKIIKINDIKKKLKKIDNNKKIVRRLTDISAAFHFLPKKWIEFKKNVEIYILTDGDINRDTFDFKQQIKTIFDENMDKKIKIHIISVENNSKDYTNLNYEAGNEIYKILQKQNLMFYVKSFISFNNLYIDEGHTNFYNPDLPEGYIPFKHKCFQITKTNQFVLYINNLIQEIKENKTEMTKLIYDLAITIYNLLKYKPDKIKNDIIETFCNLFSETNEYNEIRQCLFKEIENHKNGRSITFQEYRIKRTKLFESAQTSLYDDALKNITYSYQLEYFTFPICTKDDNFIIYRCRPNSIKDTIRLGIYEYKNGGIKINNHIIPIFPKNIVYNLFTNQCLRQWIRAIYSQLYKKTANDDLLMYLFLTDVLKICLSNVNDDIKKTYVNLAFVMLDRKRYQSDGIKELQHLEMGNPPLPVLDNFEKMEHILESCIKLTKFCLIKPYTLWYAIILILNNDKLKINQYKYCQESILIDFPDIINCPFKLLEKLKNKNKISIEEKNYGNITDNFEYYCYITMDDTTETGGYKIPSHLIGNKISCNPKYILSHEGHKSLKENNDKIIKCPICYSEIKIDKLEIILPKKNYEMKEFNDPIESEFFNVLSHKIIDIKKIKDNIDFNKIYIMDELNFETTSYEFTKDTPIIINKLNQHLMTTRTENQFNSKINEKYNFITKIDMTNICIAGGFVKSILLNQQINDIDFFFHGITNKKEILMRLKKLITEIIKEFKNLIPNVFFMLIYKENNNVYEILCLEHLFKNNNISEENIMQNPDNFKFHYKIQIILTNNLNIQSIFNKFDLWSCCVAYDGKHVYFNDESYYSYKYMINIIDESKYSDLFDMRLQKYFTYGFSIVLPNLNIQKIKEIIDISDDKIFILNNNCKFDVYKINENIIIVNEFKILNSSNKKDYGALYESVISEQGHILNNNYVLKSAIKYIETINSDETISEKIYYKFINKINNINETLFNKYFNGDNVKIKIVAEINKTIKNYNWHNINVLLKKE